MAKEPAAAKRRDAAAHTSVEAERAGPSFGAGAARVPRPWHTSTAPAHHCHPKAPTVVTRLQTVGVGFRCLHHHSRFPVRLEVVSRRVSKRDSHTFISLPFIVAAHLRVEISHLYLLLRPSKGQGESGDISTGVRRWWCCHSPAGATEEEIKTFTNPVLVNFLRFPNTSQFQSISAAKKKKKKSGKRKKKPHSKLQSPTPGTPAGRVARIRSSRCPGSPIGRPVTAAPSLPRGALLAAATNCRFPGEAALVRWSPGEAEQRCCLSPTPWGHDSLPAQQRLLLAAREPRSRGWHERHGGCKTGPRELEIAL